MKSRLPGNMFTLRPEVEEFNEIAWDWPPGDWRDRHLGQDHQHQHWLKGLESCSPPAGEPDPDIDDKGDKDEAVDEDESKGVSGECIRLRWN